MQEPLTFAMGQTTIEIPLDRRYSAGHLWALEAEDSLRVGLSPFALRLLGRIDQLEWTIGPGAAVAASQTIGTVEGSKAVSDLFAPAGGTIVRFNLDLLLRPGLVNREPYGEGWLFAMRSESAELLSAQEYLEHVAQAWPAAQRILKSRFGAQPGCTCGCSTTGICTCGQPCQAGGGCSP